MIYTGHAGSFSVGIPWKYRRIWTYETRMLDDEYLVRPYYKELKEEMLNYDYLSTREYENIFSKANQCMQTAIAKSLTYKGYYTGDPVAKEHLICLIMYTDYTELSRGFTLSFK